MAPTRKKKANDTSDKSKSNSGSTTAETKERAKAAIQKLKAKDSKETKDTELIAKLEAALKAKDEDFQSQNINDDIDAMDIDADNNESGEAGEEGGEGSKDDGDENKKNDDNEGGEGAEKTTDPQEGRSKDENKGKNEEKSKDGDEKKNGDGEPKDNIKKEPEDDNPLFMPEKAESSDEEEDPEYGRPLYRRHDPKLGNVKTVGWAGGRSRLFVNQYGPKNASIHRLNKCADSAEYEEKLPELEKVSNKNNRRGDEILDNGNLRYTRRHIHAIYAVAWEGDGSPDDLQLIDPELVDKKWPGSYVLVGWYIDGKIEKTWEPRQSLRTRWGRKDADNAIYKAAYEAENRYGEVTSGQRRATSRSPSVGLVADTVRQQRDKSLGAGRSSSSGSRSSTPTRSSPSRSKSSTPARSVRFSNSNNSDDEDELVEMLDEFKISYLECAGVETFRDLDPKDKTDFVTSWQLRKKQLNEER